MPHWIDTHCHLDAPEFAHDVQAVRARAAAQNVRHCVLPAVDVASFAAVRQLAHQSGDSYALGIHPLRVPHAQKSDLALLDAALQQHRNDPRLVAVGEIGLDFLVSALCSPAMRERQQFFYRAQLRLARRYDLPVILHVRRSADLLLQGLREVGGATPGPAPKWQGIAHAFNGSVQQAEQFIAQGLKLGFGGALTFERALQLRRLALALPLSALVLETDAPDMPPHWLYQTAQARQQGQAQSRNEPAELPRIAQTLAQLRGLALPELAQATCHNAVAALPKLKGLVSV